MDKITDWLWAAFSGLFMLLWGTMYKRVDTHEQRLDALRHDMEAKVSVAEHDRTRDSIAKIFDKLDEQGKVLARIDATLTYMQDLPRLRRSDLPRRAGDQES